MINSYVINGYDFKEIMPDGYGCPARYGSYCNVVLEKLDSGYCIASIACTESFRDEPVSLHDYELLLNNWMLSDRLYYFWNQVDFSLFSSFVSNCINGYRHITYIKQQQAIDSSFTIKNSKTPHHTYIALNNAIAPSIELYNSLQNSGKFDKNQLLSFSRYLEFPYFHNHFRDVWAQGIEKIAPLKEVFDYIVANPVNINNIVTPKIITDFQQKYKTYQEDAEKYVNETEEERRDRLNQELISKGLRPRRFPQ